MEKSQELDYAISQYNRLTNEGRHDTIACAMRRRVIDEINRLKEEIENDKGRKERTNSKHTGASLQSDGALVCRLRDYKNRVYIAILTLFRGTTLHAKEATKW